MIDIDTLRFDALGVFGSERDTSPAIDALARESFRFAAAYSQAPTTLPSQSSIFTGLYPRAHGATYRDRGLAEGVRTAAEIFAARGYRTAAFVDGGYMNRRFGHARGYDTYEDTPGGRGFAKIVPQALAWLEHFGREPFLLVVHSYDVHTPYSPPEPFRTFFTKELAAPTPGFEPDVEHMEAIREQEPKDPSVRLGTRDLAFARARYDGGVRYADFWVGELLDGLRRLEILDEIIVVLISDHGEEFQEHGSVLHEKLYRTVTHVPLLIRLPGGRPHGTVSQTVEAIDLLPSLLDLTFSETLPGVQGRTFVPAMKGSASEAGQSAFGEAPFFGRQRYLVQDRYQLIWTLDPEGYELYDMARDPLEQQDLADAQPALLARMQARLELLDRYAAAPSHLPIGLPPELARELRALGYIR